MFAFYTTRAVLLVRNALFLSSRLSYKTVPELLPKGSVSFQVDLNGHLAALFVRDKLDSGHALFYRRIQKRSRVAGTAADLTVIEYSVRYAGRIRSTLA